MLLEIDLWQVLHVGFSILSCQWLSFFIVATIYVTSSYTLHIGTTQSVVFYNTLLIVYNASSYIDPVVKPDITVLYAVGIAG